MTSSAIPIRGNRRRGPSVRSPIAPAYLPASCSSDNFTLHLRADEEMFNYDPQHLDAWLMQEDIWNELPQELKALITTTQRAGAVVLTALRRLEILQMDLPPEEEPTSPRPESSAASLKEKSALDLINRKLDDVKAIQASRPNRPKRRGTNEVFDLSPVATRPSVTLSNEAHDSSRSEKSSDTHSTDYMSPTARVSPPSMMSPSSPDAFYSPVMTPLELGEVRLPTISRRDSELAMSKSANLLRRDSDMLSNMTSNTGSFSGKLKLHAPKHPKATMYHAELEQLRQRDLVRLRHSRRPVSALYHELKTEAPLADKEPLRIRFEQWWVITTRKIDSLDDRIKSMCEGIHFSVGWSDTPGLDHRYNDLIDSMEKASVAASVAESTSPKTAATIESAVTAEKIVAESSTTAEKSKASGAEGVSSSA